MADEGYDKEEDVHVGNSSGHLSDGDELSTPRWISTQGTKVVWSIPA